MSPFSGLISLSALGNEFEREAALILGIGVVPMPLRRGHLDRRIGRRDRQFIGQQAKRRNGDDHQDQHRNDRPDDFHQRIVGGLRGRRIGLLVELPDHVGQQAQHQKGDRRDDRHQQVVVEPLDLLGDRGHRLLKADLSRLRQANAVRQGGNGERAGQRNPERPDPAAFRAPPERHESRNLHDPAAPDCVGRADGPVGPFERQRPRGDRLAALAIIIASNSVLKPQSGARRNAAPPSSALRHIRAGVRRRKAMADRGQTIIERRGRRGAAPLDRSRAFDRPTATKPESGRKGCHCQ